MYVIDNVSCQVLFEQRIFPLIFISMIQQIFCLSPLLLIGICCQIVPLRIPLICTIQFFFEITAT